MSHCSPGRAFRLGSLIGIVTLLLLPFASCATSGATTIESPAASASSASPVLSWPADPESSIAISWWADGMEPVITLDGPGVDPRPITGTTVRGFATVEVDGLKPGSEYSYTIAEDAPRTFMTAAADPPSLSFAILGDLQPFNAETDRTTRLVLDKVASLEPDFALQIGDVAEVGISAGSWRRALAALSTLGSGTPLVMTAGNHDYYYGLPSARIFKSIFPVPYAEEKPARQNTWYSTRVGPLHIVVLDTEANGRDFDRQVLWLNEDLKSARDSGADWIFVMMHRPILSTTTAPDSARWAREIFPLSARYGVDAVFWGHDHLFEHYAYQYGANGLVFSPDDPVAESPLHMFTVGTAGARIDSLYAGFFTRRSSEESWTVYDADTGEQSEEVFTRHPWNRENASRTGDGVRYQSTDVYPDAASFYSWPFDSEADERDRVYSTDPNIRYSGDAEFFGYSYGETSLHYLWVEISRDTCLISAHYADGAPGSQGTLIRTPAGTPMRWEIKADG